MQGEFDDRRPARRQTADKAWVGGAAGGVSTLIMAVIAKYGGGPMPDLGAIEVALTDLALAVVGAAVSWLAVFFKGNRERADVGPVAVLLLAAVLLASCAAAAPYGRAACDRARAVALGLAAADVEQTEAAGVFVLTYCGAVYPPADPVFDAIEAGPGGGADADD